MKWLGQISFSALTVFAFASFVQAQEASLASKTTTSEQPPVESALIAKTPVLQWYERVSFNGDFRLRTESIVDQGQDDRIRNRILARFGVTGKVNDKVTVVFRLGSGNIGADNITSYNVSMGTSSDKKPVWIDLAYFDWRAFENLSVQAGKMSHPFFTPGKQQLIWDSDLTLEGGAVRFANESGACRVFANLGGFWLAEQHGGAAQSQNDGLLGAAQIGAGIKKDAFSGTLALGYFRHRVEGTQFNLSEPVTVVTAPAAGVKGNSAVGNRYAFNYDEINGGAEFATDRLPLPLMFYADYVVNAGPQDDNVGQLYGFRIGKIKDVGSWLFDYNYRTLEKDAVLAIFSDSDFGGGGTDVRGHRFNVQYQAAQNIIASATYIGSENAVSTAKGFYERAQLDFTLSF